jgi:hypothetical protein
VRVLVRSPYRCSSARQSVGLRSQRPAVRARPAMPPGSVAQQGSARLSTGRPRGQHPPEPPLFRVMPGRLTGRTPASEAVNPGSTPGLAATSQTLSRACSSFRRAPRRQRGGSGCEARRVHQIWPRGGTADALRSERRARTGRGSATLPVATRRSLAQPARASACQAEGRGCEARNSDHQGVA